MGRLLLVLVTLCCLGFQAVQCAMTTTPLHVEPFDDDYVAAHLALMCTSFSVVGVLVIAVLGSLVVRGQASLVNVMLAVVFAAVVVVGTVSWVITYATMRDEMHEKVQALIILAGDGVDVSILRSLESGVTLGRLYKKMHSYKMTSMNDSYPAPVHDLLMVRETFVGIDAALVSIYYGSKWGYTLGVWPRQGVPHNLTVFMGFPATAPLSELQHFSCRGWDHADAGCGTVNCSTASARAHCGETCLVHNTTNCYSQHTGTSRIIYYETPWGDGLPETEIAVTRPYEPRERPWYVDGMAAGGGPVWTAPYVFSAEVAGAVPVIGFSYEFAVRNPGTGEQEGVFAVDYGLGSLHTVLLGLLPTEHSTILMCDLDGVLYASSSLPGDIAIVTVDSDGKKNYEVTNVFTHPRRKIRDVFVGVQQVVGSLNEASQLRRLIQLSDSTLLVSPLNMTGLSLLVVIEVPHKDVLEAVNNTSTISLVVVLVISVVLAGGVSGLIYVLGSRLDALSQEMHDVAWMKVEGSQMTADSIVSEIRSMQASFALLVKNMMEYKQYLPQTLLADVPYEDVEESVQVCRKKILVSLDYPYTPCQKLSPNPTSHATVSSVAFTHTSHEMEISPKQRAVFNTALGHRNISVVCLNWRGTHARLHEACSEGAVTSFTAAFSAYLELAMAAAKQTRGVIDYFSGDRICVMFNAVMSALWHTRRSVECASLMENDETGKAVAGVATGHAMCGNAGCHGLKKYCAFGRVVSVAHALVRLAGSLDEEIVTEGSAVEAITHFFNFKWLQRVQLRHDNKTTLTCAVKSAVSCEKQEEWMYELAAAANPYADYNAAVTELLNGNFAAAMQSVEKVTLLPEAEVQALKARISAGAAGVTEEPLALL